MIQQTDTEWSFPETTTGCVIGPDKEKKENAKNRTDQEWTNKTRKTKYQKDFISRKKVPIV